MNENLRAVLANMVSYVEGSNAVFSKIASDHAEIDKQAPAVVNTLIKRGFLKENQRELAIKALHDPVKVLSTLQKTAEAVANENPNAAKMAALGRPVTPAPAVAERRTQKSEADARFERAFGFS